MESSSWLSLLITEWSQWNKLLVKMLPNLKFAFKTRSCSTCLDMVTIVVGSRDMAGLEGWTWTSIRVPPPRFTSSCIKKIECSPVPSPNWSTKYVSARSASIRAWEYGGFLTGSGFIGARKEVRQHQLFLTITELDVFLPIDAMENLLKFWNIFFNTIYCFTSPS